MLHWLRFLPCSWVLDVSMPLQATISCCMERAFIDPCPPQQSAVDASTMAADPQSASRQSRTIWQLGLAFQMHQSIAGSHRQGLVHRVGVSLDETFRLLLLHKGDTQLPNVVKGCITPRMRSCTIFYGCSALWGSAYYLTSIHARLCRHFTEAILLPYAAKVKQAFRNMHKGYNPLTVHSLLLLQLCEPSPLEKQQPITRA
jgi:hypothetical protein